MSYPYDAPEELWHQQTKFSDRAFGPPSHRGPIGALKHLEKEAREAQESPQDIKEYADCLILTFDAARRAGFSIYELFAAALGKVAENEKRSWPDWRTVPADEPIEHHRHHRVEPSGEGR